MEQPDVERRLAAILASDVVGYSRLMEADEAGTLARLKSVRQDLIDPAIAKCKGRVIKTTGDGMLVEFQSVIEAVRCAADFQRSMALRNEGVVDPLLYRIGINLGEHTVKNISRPIRVFRVRSGKETGAPAASGAARPKETPARVPSIAVLPFVNMSGDPDQEYFADGLTEDIITEVSRFRDLLVISRNAVFVHKGKPVTARGVAREFDVDYVVEGSVRKATDRVRVTVQLIDGETETHIWAERYDRKLEDIFAIQDEVTAAIVGTLRGRVEAATHDRAKKKRTGNMVAYEYVLAGKVLHHRVERGANEEAMRMLEQALALDPNYAHAHAWKACVLGQRFVHGWHDDVDALLGAISRELETALSLDETDADVHRILAALHLAFNRFDKALYHQERALELCPNYDLVVVQQGEVLTWLGRPEEGIEWIRKSMRINPYHPERFWSHLGRAQYVARAYGDAIQSFSRITKPDHTHFAFLAAASAQTGDASGASAYVQEVMSRAPAFTVSAYVATLHYKNETDLEHHREGLLKAGLPA